MAQPQLSDRTPEARRGWRFDPGLALALALGLIAAWPFLTRLSLPQFTDAEMHVYRAAEILASLREGILWPRWAPDFYYGYGYPVFNYYSPLTYHLAAYYALLSQTDVVAGTKAVFVLGLMLGSVGVWGFVRDRWGGAAAIVACAAYSLAPYLLYIDPHARGDAPETFALGVGPLAFWAFDRLYRGGPRAAGPRAVKIPARDTPAPGLTSQASASRFLFPTHQRRPAALAASAILMAVLVLSHPLTALVFLVWLIAWLVWAAVVVPLADEGQLNLVAAAQRLALPALALGLALGLSALYWLPVLQERQAVQLGNVAGPGYFDFRRYFLDLAELVAPPGLIDLGATEPAFHFSLGWPQIFLAAIGGLTLFARRRRRVDLFFFAFSALGLTYLMTRGSIGVWESIPQMRYFQFPTRFLGPAAFAFAVLSGASLRWLERWPRPWVQSLAAAGVTAALAAGALPLLYPPPWGEFGPVTPQRMIGVELEGRALGTTSANDFLPVDVLRVPDPQPIYLEGYDTGELIKFNAVTVPGFASARMIDSGATFARIETGATEPFVLRLFTLYFPGWHVYVDGEEVPIEVSVPDGFITFWVPTNPHEVLVQFEDTAPRRLGYAISGLSLVALAVAVGWVASRRRVTTLAPIKSDGAVEATTLNGTTAAVLALVLVAFVAVKLEADRLGWFRITSTGNVVQTAQNQQFARLGDDLALLGYDLGRHMLQPGESVPVTLYWKALAPLDHNYQVYVHLIGPDGRLWGQSDKLNPADFPTARWPTDRYVRDEHRPVLSADAPPGVYAIVVGLWDSTSGARLPAFDEAGAPIGQGVILSEAVQAR